MKKNYFLFLLFFAVITVKAQTVNDILEDPTRNYFDVVNYFNTYFKTHSTGKGSGYKLFKRWETEMKYWVDEQGNRIDPKHFTEEMKKFNASSANYKNNSAVSATWTELGPQSWNCTSSWAPGLGRIDAVAVHPLDNKIIYVGSPNGGCWKTTDGGVKWASLTDGQLFMKIGDVEVDPINLNTVYIGTMGSGLLKSTDGGTTLVASGTGLASGINIRKIIVDPSNTSVVLLATSGGIYRSTNGGANWTSTSTGSFYDMDFQPGNSSIVYACGKDFYRSSNGGTSFTKITAGISVSDVMRLAVTPNNPNLVAVVQCAGNIFGKVYKSTDAGQTFSTTITGSAANGTNFFGYEPDGKDNNGQGSYNIDIAISPADENEIHIAGINTWKSSDGGTNWAPTTEWIYPNTTGYTHCDIHALEYFGNNFYVGSDGGLSISTDKGDNFTAISNGMGIRMFYRLGCSKTDADMIAVGAQDNGGSIRKASGWIDWLGADGMETAINQNNPNIVYGSSQNGYFYRSTDAGTTYTEMVMPEATGKWTTPFIIDPNNATTLYVGFAELYKSLDEGTNWTKLSNLNLGLLDYIEVAPSNSNYIYISSGTSIYKTSDGGTTWTNIATGLGGANINRIAVHNSSPDKIVVATSGSKIYSSVDGGITYTNITGNFPVVVARCIVYQNDATEGIYIGTNSGVYFKDNTMTNWISYSSALPIVAINELEIHEATGKLRAATYGRSIWEVDLYSVVNGISVINKKNQSLDIYPNPAKSDVTITFNDGHQFDGTIEIISIDGKLVIEKNIHTPVNKLTIDVSKLSKGSYNIKLKNKNQITSSKLIIE